MKAETKFIIGIIVFSLIFIVGAYFFLSKPDKPLLGKDIEAQASHVPKGTNVDYNSNPPVGGEHYGDSTAHAGFYSEAPQDGYIVHSLEHGAVVLWYDPKQLSRDEIEKLKTFFDQIPGKTIMSPRVGMSSSVSLSSWGRVLNLGKIDEKQIRAFFETNMNRGPESAPI